VLERHVRISLLPESAVAADELITKQIFIIVHAF
jgi:hypothetical protein